MKNLYFIVILLVIFKIFENVKVAKPKSASLDGLSDVELDKMMKEYGISDKDLGVLGTGNSDSKGKSGKDKKDPLFDLEEDPLKSILGEDPKKQKNKILKLK